MAMKYMKLSGSELCMKQIHSYKVCEIEPYIEHAHSHKVCGIKPYMEHAHSHAHGWGVGPDEGRV